MLIAFQQILETMDLLSWLSSYQCKITIICQTKLELTSFLKLLGNSKKTIIPEVLIDNLADLDINWPNLHNPTTEQNKNIFPYRKFM